MKKVVIIDDEPFILMIVEDKLRKAGYEVISKRTSDGIVEFIKNNDPDLVIIDWMLPGASGLDVCKDLTNDPKTSSIPVFMLTAKGQESDEKLGIKCGAKQYITKPFSPRALLKLIEDTIGKPA
jgi:two-component system phosphate regulon response regulator PhoB